MARTDRFQDLAAAGADPSRSPGALLDVLGVAAVLLDAEGRIMLWSPQAEELFGYRADEVLGRPAARVLVDEDHAPVAMALFAGVMDSGEGWAGVFPVRRKDGSSRLAEFRNVRLEDAAGGHYALGLASDSATLRRIEGGLALAMRLFEQSPIGLAVLDTGLRYLLVNPALERINGLTAEAHVGRRITEALPFLDTEPIEGAMRSVLETGDPVLDLLTVGRTPADEDHDHAWSGSVYRLEDPLGRPLGLAVSVVDITEQHRAAQAADRARQRLALIADASARLGTTLELDITAQELADLVVPALADVAAVDVLDSMIDPASGEDWEEERAGPDGSAVFRALAVKAGYPTPAVRAADPVDQPAQYDAARLVTRSAATGKPVVVPHVGPGDLEAIARDRPAAELLRQAGVHSYLAVPLLARGRVLGVLDLKRARNQHAFDEDDLLLAQELASRAAVCIDNARWYQRQRTAALVLQRHLLPRAPVHPYGLETAYRYQPAVAGEVGGDWFDVIPLEGDKTALVVGDVMGSGITAAATMGQLRAAARTLAGLDLDPAQVLQTLNRAANDLEETIATCVYAVHDPHRARCRIALAGHLPPVLARSGRGPELLDLPTGAPLGVDGVAFEAVEIPFRPGDQLVLYTDGLVETRDQDIDLRLDILVAVLGRLRRPLEETCDLLLRELRKGERRDDVALLIARATGTR